MSQSNATTVSTCPECGGTGWARVQRGGTPGVARCECYKKSRLPRLLQAARIPKRYTLCSLENYDLSRQSPAPNRRLSDPGVPDGYVIDGAERGCDSNRRLTDQSHERAKLVAEKFVAEYPMSMPFGLLFMGPPGVGKTHLAVGIIKALIQLKGVPCLFRTFPELLKEIQNSYSPISQSSELSLLAPVLETEVLVLDELGSQNFSSWVKDTVSYIINYRYAESKVTIFTTNLLDKKGDEPQVAGGSVSVFAKEPDAKKGITEALVDRIGDQMRSRLFEMCKTVVIGGNNVDFRREVKQIEHHF